MADTVRIRLGVAGVLMLAVALFAQEEPAGWLGVFMQNVNESIAAQQGLKSPAGVWVRDVIKESPAEKGGLLKNDIILKLDGKAIGDTAGLKKMIQQRADKTVQVEILRATQPLSLSIVIGEKKKNEEWLTVTAFDEESSGDNAEKEGHLRQAVDSYLKALTQMKSPAVDFRLRKKIIAIVQRLEVPPATPEQAERAMTVARAAQAEATDENGYNKAIRNYAEASLCAPWLADLYFNLGVLYDRQNNFEHALRNFRLYLLAAPGAEDAQKVKDKIYLLEDKQKEQEAAQSAGAKVRQEGLDRVNKEKSMRRFTIALSYGQNDIKSSSFHWTRTEPDSTFNRVYKGIKWESGLHVGLEGTMRMYFNPKGSSFFISPGMLSIMYEKSNSAPGTVQFTDSLAHTTVSRDLKEGAFTESRFGIADMVAMGYRIKFNRVVGFEPYAGFIGKFEMFFFSGPEVTKRDFSNTTWIRCGFPFGANIYLSSFFVGFEYNTFFKLTDGEMMYYNDPTLANSKREKGVFSMDGESYWTIHAGVIF